MDIYRTPQSELVSGTIRPYAPYKGLLIGLLHTIFLVTLVSYVWLFLFGAINGLDISAPNFGVNVKNNPIYLATDVMVTVVVLYFAGRGIGFRTPGEELKFGVILGVLTVAIYLSLILTTGGLFKHSLFYNLAYLASPLLAIPLGAKHVAKS